MKQYASQHNLMEETTIIHVRENSLIQPGNAT